MNKATMAFYVCIGFMIWGAWVDAQGLPVLDQVILSSVFGSIAIWYSEKGDR